MENRSCSLAGHSPSQFLRCYLSTLAIITKQAIILDLAHQSDEESISTQQFLEESIPGNLTHESTSRGPPRKSRLWHGGDLSYPKHDEEVSFAVEVKTGPYAELERDQRDVAEAIAAADDRLHPVIVTVDITELPQSFHVDTQISVR